MASGRGNDKPQNFEAAKESKRLEAQGLQRCLYCKRWFRFEDILQKSSHRDTCTEKIKFDKEMQELRAAIAVNKSPINDPPVRLWKSKTGRTFDLKSGFQRQNFLLPD